MDAQKEREAFERFKAEKIGIAYEELKVDLDDCERRFGKRYAGWNFSDDWEVWQAAKASVAECTWSHDSSDEMYGVWHTKCGNSFVLNEDGPTENKMNHCCYCGSKLIEAQEPSNG